MIDEDLKDCCQIDRGDFVEFWRDSDIVHCDFKDGWKIWFQKDTLHRDNLPAVIKPDGTQFYFEHGKLHRLDGPAVMRNNSDGNEFWINGIRIKQKIVRLTN